jgi:hypothetical protein
LLAGPWPSPPLGGAGLDWQIVPIPDKANETLMGLLDDPRARAVYDRIESGQLEAAQQLLGVLGEEMPENAAIVYLTTRLLYERGHLASSEVLERMQRLLEEVGVFPEAEELCLVATEGARHWHTVPSKPNSLSEPPLTEPAGDFRHGTTPTLEYATWEPEGERGSSEGTSGGQLPAIPRAPAVPNFSPPFDLPAGPDLDSPETSREPWRARASAKRAHGPQDEAPITAREPPRPSDRFDEAHRPRRVPSMRVNPKILPGLFNVATLLGEGLFEQALSALDRLNAEVTPELLLLRGRALLGAKRPEEARAVAQKLLEAPLEPESRSACARLLLELGEIDAALEQAERACNDDPGSGVARAALLRTLVRLAWQRRDAAALERASLLLRNERPSPAPMAALEDTLRACVEALIGDGLRAAELARAALKSDPNSLDGLVALAFAAARSGELAEARETLERLAKLDPKAAETVRERISDSESSAAAPSDTRKHKLP